MSGAPLSKADNLFDFFHESVDAAAARRHPPPVSEDGVYYLTTLLVEQSRVQEQDQAAEQPTLAELHMRATQSSRPQAIQTYRRLGDRALYVTGSFRQSLEQYVGQGAFVKLDDRELRGQRLVVRKDRALNDPPDAVRRRRLHGLCRGDWRGKECQQRSCHKWKQR